MKHSNFIMKLMGAVFVLVILFCYQKVALQRSAQVTQRESEIAEVEAYNSEILAQEQARAAAEETENQEVSETSEADVRETLADGTYTGSGQGYGGTITVDVTIESGKIRSVSLVSYDGEDQSYFQEAQSLTAVILKTQSADVDTISGATASSQGIIDAVTDALSQAKEG